jgi:hypothetical protein
VNQKLIFLLTFDYEVFLGTNFLPYDQILFEPTARIMEICDKLSVPATFFPDVCSVWAHRAAGLNEYAEKFESQMKKALASGHDVQLHLHPHWLDSVYEDGRWTVLTDRMYLHELGFGYAEGSAGALIERGVLYLNELLGPVSPDYRCQAFRAAGLALQPNEKEILGALGEKGIKVDTSIAKGLKMNIDTVRIDYSRTPSSANWYINSKTGIETEGKDGILEIPIATFRSNIPAQFGFIFRRAKSIRQVRGMTVSRVKRQSRMANLRTMILQNLRYVTGRPRYLLSFDTKGFNLEMLLGGLADYISKYKNDRMITASIISHPKLMFDDQMKLMSGFIQESRRRFDITYATCTQAYKMHDHTA